MHEFGPSSAAGVAYDSSRGMSYHGSRTFSNAGVEEFSFGGDVWSVCYDDGGYRYFFNSTKSTSSWDDPRESACSGGLMSPGSFLSHTRESPCAGGLVSPGSFPSHTVPTPNVASASLQAPTSEGGFHQMMHPNGSVLLSGQASCQLHTLPQPPLDPSLVSALQAPINPNINAPPSGQTYPHQSELLATAPPSHAIVLSANQGRQ